MPLYYSLSQQSNKQTTTARKKCSGRCYTLGSESGPCGSGCGSERPARRGRNRDESQPQRLLISSDPEIPFRAAAAATRRMARSQNRGVEVEGNPRKVSGGYLPSPHLPNWLPRWRHRRHDSLGRRAKPKHASGQHGDAPVNATSGAEASSTGNAGARACVRSGKRNRMRRMPREEDYWIRRKAQVILRTLVSWVFQAQTFL